MYDWRLGTDDFMIPNFLCRPVDNLTVFECKYEIDSLCSFLKLSTTYYNETKDASIMNDACEYIQYLQNLNSTTNPISLLFHWNQPLPWLTYFHAGFTAIDQIFQVINNQSQGSWDENFNFISYFNWTGEDGSLSPAVNNGGNGEPKAFTGMVRLSSAVYMWSSISFDPL